MNYEKYHDRMQLHSIVVSNEKERKRTASPRFGEEMYPQISQIAEIFYEEPRTKQTKHKLLVSWAPHKT